MELSAIAPHLPLPNIMDILYVEDDIEDARLIVRSFDDEKSISYQITHSSTFADALLQLRQKKFGAILLDLNLPDGKGLEGIDDIKNINPDLPVVILTGYDDENTAIEALQKGAQEYIVKSHINNDIIKRVLQSSILRKKVEQSLKKQAYTDPLTGLPNRVAFEQTASKMIERAARWKNKEALLFLDLNKFKEINDTYGHEAGNAVLVETAARLQLTLRKSDMIARYAGDEFICYLDSNNSPKINKDICQAVSQKIIEAVEKPIVFEGKKLFISVSIGIAIFPDAGNDFDALLKKADAAMYQAKKNSDEKFCFVDAVMEDEIDTHITVSNPRLEWKGIITLPHADVSNNNVIAVLPPKVQTGFKSLEDIQDQFDTDLSSFAFMAAHDLRAPVRKIITFTEMLENQYEDLEQDEKQYLLQRLSLSGTRINHLIDNLLLYANSIKNYDKMEKCCLTTIVEEILDDLKFWLQENNVSVQVGPLPQLLAYKNQIRCIFYHLINNAVIYKNMDIQTKIKVFETSNKTESIICISDNGIGIDPNYMKKIFDPFKRLHSADQIEGTGLGLAICQRAIEKHGGTIWVEPNGDKGSIFKFSFPLKS